MDACWKERSKYAATPGVAAIAAAAYAGLSLTHRDLASAVAFVTGHEDPTKPEAALDYAALARFPGTLVFYMGLHRLPRIAAALVAPNSAAELRAAELAEPDTEESQTAIDATGYGQDALGNAATSGGTSSTSVKRGRRAIMPDSAAMTAGSPPAP